MFVDVSAKAGTGLDRLLEAVVLTADASLDLRANPEQNAEGLAIEAHLDRGRGPVATVLVQRGTLRVGDTLVAGSAFGRVRALLDEFGENVDEALPSRPVLVLGLTAVPGAGDNFMVVDDDRIARQIAEKREARERNAALAKRSGRRTLEEFMAHVEKGETNELLLILKGDSSGSVEALEDALAGINVGEEVALRVIDRGVGAITETNVDLASASDAVIIGYNVRPQGKATELADREGVEIKYYSVIYQAIDEIEAALKGLLKPIYEERATRYRRDSRDLPLQQDRQHRRLHGHQRHDQAELQGPPAPRRCGRRRQRRPRQPAAGEGRRQRGPRGLRVRLGAQGLTATSRSAMSSRPSNSSKRRATSGRLDHGRTTTQQLADRIRVIVATMLERRIKDPRLGFVTLTDVRLTGDNQNASIFYTVMGGQEAIDGTAAALRSASGLIRSEVGKQLGLRHTPTIEFFLDAVPENAKQIEDLLAKAREADEAVAAQATGAQYAGEADPYKNPPSDEDADEAE